SWRLPSGSGTSTPRGDVTRLAIVRALDLARAVLGAGHLAFPGWAAQRLTPGPIGLGARRVIQVLGGRQLLQAAATRARPTGAVLALGAGIAVLPAVSMVALAARRREWREPALLDAAVAAGLAALGVTAARLAPVPPPAD